jgi:hypothetical protein
MDSLGNWAIPSASRRVLAAAGYGPKTLEQILIG